jgi:cysteine synthase
VSEGESKGLLVLSRIDELMAGIRVTPTSEITVHHRGVSREVALKHESCNPSGSVKHRTATGLLMALDRMRPLEPGTVVVESTSGNLGLAMARLLRGLDCRLIAVVDPKIPEETRTAMTEAGVQVRTVVKPDGHGGYLLTRLDEVRTLCAANPGHRWTDQYSNYANPMIHSLTTGPEIIEQGGPDLDCVYAAVSTGGTLAGISACLRRTGRPITVVAVDASGSLVTGAAGADRLIAGLGASRPSTFLTPGSYDYAVRMSGAETVALCRIFEQDSGMALGGSSGAVLAACVRDVVPGRSGARALCLSADDGTKYRSTIYSDDWLRDHRVADEVHAAADRYRAAGLAFEVHDAARGVSDPARLTAGPC